MILEEIGKLRNRLLDVLGRRGRRITFADSLFFIDELDTIERMATQLQNERTCKPVKEYFGRSGQSYRLVCSECHHVMWDGFAMGTKPNYCQNCGAKVVR